MSQEALPDSPVLPSGPLSCPYFQTLVVGEDKHVCSLTSQYQAPQGNFPQLPCWSWALSRALIPRDQRTDKRRSVSQRREGSTHAFHLRGQQSRFPFLRTQRAGVQETAAITTSDSPSKQLFDRLRIRADFRLAHREILEEPGFSRTKTDNGRQAGVQINKNNHFPSPWQIVQ